MALIETTSPRILRIAQRHSNIDPKSLCGIPMEEKKKLADDIRSMAMSLISQAKDRQEHKVVILHIDTTEGRAAAKTYAHAVAEKNPKLSEEMLAKIREVEEETGTIA